MSAATAGRRWVATTLPMATTPALFKLKCTTMVQLPRQSLVCHRCTGQAQKPMEEWYDLELALALQNEIPAPHP